MAPTDFSTLPATYLNQLCVEITNRQTGSPGNHKATDLVAGVFESYGFSVDTPGFKCLDWTGGEVYLSVGGKRFPAEVSPFSLGCHIRAPLEVVATLDDLKDVKTTGKILLVHKDLAKEQLMPKGFQFYNPDRHKQIIRLLEARKPAAIIAATSRNPDLAGGLYPFPLFEDGDFDIPSVFLTEEAGADLAQLIGQEILLNFDAERLPSTGQNVYARKGEDLSRRIVVCAHIDAKAGTPGALDNATGVVVLLLLADLLQTYTGDLGIEIVALNGEDYYSAPGEMQFVRQNRTHFAEILLGINLDLAGYKHGMTAYSLYNCPPEIAGLIRTAFSSRENMLEGEPWYQSDHSLFIQNDRPALAITSDRFIELSTYVTHTQRDTIDLVDTAKLTQVALVLKELVIDLNTFFG
jgi:aminopeptidase YwaD